MKAIVVLQAGWVFTGVYHAAVGTKPPFMTEAACVRRWGTSEGLGELALKGPTPQTVLDPAGVVVFDNLKAVLFSIVYADSKPAWWDKRPADAGRTHLVVIDNGWVYMGKWTPATSRTPAFLTEASCVRRWGTTEGLGEIALKGPTPDTVLDPAGLVVFDNPRAILFSIPCQ